MPTEAHFKIILIGDCRVGKTSYLNCIINKHTINKGQNLPPTIGVEYAPTKVRVRGQEVKINLWDTSGAEKYKSITSSYYRKCQGAIIMFDLTDAESFRNLEGWFREVQKRSTQKFCKIVIANKLDLVESGEKQRMVSQKEIIDFCLKHSVTYKYTSAVSGFNIQESFMDLVEKIFDEFSTSNTYGNQMQSQSWDGNPDLSLLPHQNQVPQNKKISEPETTGCPTRCC